jgi:hypothetical protein
MDTEFWRLAYQGLRLRGNPTLSLPRFTMAHANFAQSLIYIDIVYALHLI